MKNFMLIIFRQNNVAQIPLNTIEAAYAIVRIVERAEGTVNFQITSLKGI
jgi:hypothetical protein